MQIASEIKAEELKSTGKLWKKKALWKSCRTVSHQQMPEVLYLGTITCYTQTGALKSWMTTECPGRCHWKDCFSSAQSRSSCQEIVISILLHCFRYGGKEWLRNINFNFSPLFFLFLSQGNINKSLALSNFGTA